MADIAAQNAAVTNLRTIRSPLISTLNGSNSNGAVELKNEITVGVPVAAVTALYTIRGGFITAFVGESKTITGIRTDIPLEKRSYLFNKMQQPRIAYNFFAS